MCGLRTTQSVGPAGLREKSAESPIRQGGDARSVTEEHMGHAAWRGTGLGSLDHRMKYSCCNFMHN